jgi:hypothetical protein
MNPDDDEVLPAVTKDELGELIVRSVLAVLAVKESYAAVFLSSRPTPSSSSTPVHGLGAAA